MAIGFKPQPSEQQPDDKLLWTMQKGDRRLTAVCRSIPIFDALELRFDVSGRLLHSQLYRGAALANIKPDAEAKREELPAMGWSVAGDDAQPGGVGSAGR